MDQRNTTQSRHEQAPVALDDRTVRELLTGVALFGGNGIMLDANEAFLSAMGGMDEPTDCMEFTALFGRAPDTFADQPVTPVVVAGRHLTVTTRWLADRGWLCQLQDVTAWVVAKADADAAVHRDGLTGLPNRTAILPEIARAVGDPTRAAALLMIDLDRFKAVNDTLGHPIGDALLRKVADRLTASLRATDTVARLGGDEFAVLQVGAAQPLGAETLAKRLVEVLSRPYIIEGHMIDVGASVGVAVASDGINQDELLKQTDIALYRAKQGGRARYTFFERHMNEEMQERRALEIDLRRALAFRQFELHYQPRMCVATQTVTGMEALIRWRHPERGLVPPNDFIPLAEETGLIVPIGEWVIRQACQDSATWPGEPSVAVNVSAKQLASGKLVRAVEDALERAGLPASRLEIEITESVLMTDASDCVATLHRLRELGARVSMDDFGTGYSSLSYLRSFPFDKIKIDQSFVRQGDAARNDGIVRAITAIGRHLGMATIAEGVETEEQWASISASGCGAAQGYLVSRPVPADEVLELFARFQADSQEVHAKPQSVADIAELNASEIGLYRLVYYSRNAIYGLDEEVIGSVDAILAKSQANNARVGVTGALMFTDGYFAQVLEGTRAAVEDVFERIQLDDRHADVQLLSFAPVDARYFPAWSMAFVGNAERGRQQFGHYAASSGFDFAAADSDAMIAHLRTLLLDEEGSFMKAAA